MRYTLLLLLSLSLSAVELNLNKDTNLSVEQTEIDIVQKAYQGKNASINLKKLKTYLKDNRILSNMYLDRHNPLTEDEAMVLKHTIENVLAAKVIKEIQEETKISDDVVKSYYIAHQDDYMNEPTYDYTYISFETFEKASTFYLTHKDDIKTIFSYVKESNATVQKFVQKSESSVYYTIGKEAQKTETPFILAPQKLEEYVIMYVQAKHKPLPIPYEVVKANIKEMLFQKTATEKRNKLMLDYEQKAK